MSSKTKIVVLHMKEIIYTIIFTIFLFLIIGLLFSMFSSKSISSNSNAIYIPGIYSSSITLNGTPLTVEVSVDSAQINSVRISNMTDELHQLYPLLQPTIEELSAQICLNQSLDNLTISNVNSSTASLLLSTIEATLKKAVVP